MGRNGWIIVLLITLFIFACSEKKDKKEDWSIYKSKNVKNVSYSKYIKNGFRYYKKRNIRNAYYNLKMAYKAGSKDPLVLFKLAFLMQKKKMYNDSLKLYSIVQKSIEKKYPDHPYNKKTYLNKGIIFYKTKKYRKALNSYLKGFKKFKDDEEIAYNLGMVYRPLKKYGLSASYFEKADQSDFTVNYYLAKAYHKLARLKDAIKTMKKAVSIKINSSKAIGALANYYYMLAENLQKKKKYKEVLKVLKKSKKLYKKAENLNDDPKIKYFYTESIKAVIMKEYAIKKHLGQGSK